MSAMTTALQISINFSAYNLRTLYGDTYSQKPINFRTKSGTILPQKNRFKLRVYKERFSFSGGAGKDGILLKKKKKKKRLVLVRSNQGFGFNGGGGGGGKDDGTTARVLGNLALAIGLTYLSITGQLGWLLDAIVSIWLLAVIIPIVGLGAFLWWAGRDIVQDSCPNCGNDFQIFKSTMNDDLQLCPFCSQPFSVCEFPSPTRRNVVIGHIVDNKFVRDSVKFSNQSTTFAEAFNEFSRSRKGKETSAAVVDVEAEIKDAD